MAAPKAGGFKLSLAGAKSKPGFKAPVEKLAKRPRLALGDDEPEDDNKKQEISGWDVAEGGAVDVNGKKEEDKGPRIIPSLPNRNWREEARKRQLAKAGVHPEQNGNAPDQMEEPKVAYGLTTFEKRTSESAEPQSTEPATSDPKDADDGLTEEQRLEKQALASLLSGKSSDQTVIPIQSEEETLQNDLRDAAEAPTLEAYEATPIEGFGAALLRGMGWKEGEESSRDKKLSVKPKEIKRRPALLGIGAKEEAAVGVELGAWGKPKGKKPAVSYNPITLKNKHTGEMITEDELKARLEKQKMVDDEKPSRSSKHDDDDERRREKRRDRRRDDDYDSERRRDKDRRRDREDEYSDRERRREKKKYRDEEYTDSDRRRDKKRDKDRRERSRSPYDEDRRDRRRDRERRHRSRSADSDDYKRAKRRERERRDKGRSRSRDSEDRRKRRREYEYDDERDDRKRRYKDDKYYRK